MVLVTKVKYDNTRLCIIETFKYCVVTLLISSQEVKTSIVIFVESRTNPRTKISTTPIGQ